MDGLRFREATRADDEFFFEVEFQTTWSSLDPEDRRTLEADQVRSALRETHELLLQRPGNMVLVAETTERERVGLLWFGVSRNLVTGEDEAWVYNVTVLSHFQGRGYGRQMLEHAEKLARTHGFRVLGLMVSSHNERARRLYERMEFRATNLVMRKFLE